MAGGTSDRHPSILARFVVARQGPSALPRVAAGGQGGGVDSQSTVLPGRSGVPAIAIAMSRTADWLSFWLAAAATVGAGLTVVAPGVLHGTAAMNGSARGTAAVMLVVGVPTLLAVTLVGRPDHVRLGVLAYLTYNCVLLLFATPFNELFLIYVAMLGLALAALVAHAVRIVPAATGRPGRRIAGLVAGYLGLVAIGNAVAWLVAIVPALASAETPGFLTGTGLTTNPVYVQDLAVWLPLAVLAAVGLWRGRPWGALVAGGILVMWVLEGISIAVDQWAAARADPGSPVASTSMVVPFLVLAAISAGVLILLRRGPALAD